jgi:hypothetical protein
VKSENLKQPIFKKESSFHLAPFRITKELFIKIYTGPKIKKAAFFIESSFSYR